MGGITDTDRLMMSRAIQLARRGGPDTSPNPKVGCVIADPDGTILGEGYHRRCGEGHAEVNAVASLRPGTDLSRATVYVTLEPCSHVGRTPACAAMLAKLPVPRVAVGMTDPNPKVAGRGMAMLREAGKEVVCGVLENECRALNPMFLTAFTQPRPFVTLKWAQSADGYLDRRRTEVDQPAERFSSPLSAMSVQELRAGHDAVMCGSGTVLADSPRLTVRGWDGPQPVRIAVDRSGRLDGSQRMFGIPGALLCSPERPAALPTEADWLEYRPGEPLAELLCRLRGRGITSLLVEGGAELHRAFIEAGLWDRLRIETAPWQLGSDGTHRAPAHGGILTDRAAVDGRIVGTFRNPESEF